MCRAVASVGVSNSYPAPLVAPVWQPAKNIANKGTVIKLAYFLIDPSSFLNGFHSLSNLFCALIGFTVHIALGIGYDACNARHKGRNARYAQQAEYIWEHD
jgi:hypothetical protein